jgi:hypothetical protein
MNPDNQDQQPPRSPFTPGSVYGPPNKDQPSSQISNQPEPHNYDDGSSKKTKKIIMLLAGLVAVFTVVVIVALLAGGGNKPPENAVEDSTRVNDLYKEPTAIEIENLNNSVSDDITNLSTDADFPSDKLSDDSLKL